MRRPDITSVVQRVAANAGDVAALHRDLSELAVRAEGQDLGAAAGMDEVEKRIGAIWAEMLGVEAVAPDADFFALGGDSILAVQVLSRIHSELDVLLSLAEMLDGDLTVRGLAALIAASKE